MAIPWNVEDLPLLPEDYPLFDWDDFPESYAALVPGGPTKNFRKEAWNAMMDKMAAAVAVADGSFHENFWITEPYGKLYANHIDGVFLMYQQMTGLPDNLWPWNDRNSRAYLPYGYPLKGDKVYPEYLLYLFQRVNFLLELLKGRIELPDVGTQQRSATISYVDFFRAVSAPINTQHFGQTKESVEVKTATSLPASAQAAAKSKTAVEVKLDRSASADVWQESNSRTQLSARVRIAVPAETSVKGKSTTSAEVFARNIQEVAAKVSAGSSADVKIPTPEAIPMQIEQTAGSALQVEGSTAEARPAAVQDVLSSTSQVMVLKQRSRPIWAEFPAVSSQKADVEKLTAVSVAVHQYHRSLQHCGAGIWLLPLQPDRDTLHIRQTLQRPILLDDVLYIDLRPEQGVTDKGTLVLWQIWQNAVQIQDTLYIGAVPPTGMIDDDTLLIWDVSVQPVQTGDQLEVF